MQDIYSHDGLCYKIGLKMWRAPNRYRKLAKEWLEKEPKREDYLTDLALKDRTQTAVIDMQKKEFPNERLIPIGLHVGIDNDWYVTWEET